MAITAPTVRRREIILPDLGEYVDDIVLSNHFHETKL
jgi:hypothetical protein